MKKYIYLSLLLIVCFSISSCVNEEDNLFEDSAAQRLNKAVSDYSSILESSENGWVMNYYPGDTSMGGFTHTVIFKDGKATIASEEDFTLDNKTEITAGTEQKSLYQVKAEQECLLTFDTYNFLFHFWSEPKGSSNVNGYSSDYEFMFKKISDDRILLKGKKYGNTLELIKLNESASEYLKKVIANKEILSQIPRSHMIVNGKTLDVTMVNKVLTYKYKENEKDTTNTVSFIYTDKGIKLYKPISIDGIEAQEFVPNDNGELKSIDSDIMFPYPSTLEFIYGGAAQWHIGFDLSTGESDMSPTMYNIMENIQDINGSAYLFKDFFIGSNPAYPDYPYAQSIGWIVSLWGIIDYYITYGVNMNAVENSTDQISITPLGESLNFSVFPECQEMIDAICNNSPYKVEVDNEKMPTKAKFTSIKDPEIWFNASK